MKIHFECPLLPTLVNTNSAKVKLWLSSKTLLLLNGPYDGPIHTAKFSPGGPANDALCNIVSTFDSTMSKSHLCKQFMFALLRYTSSGSCSTSLDPLQLHCSVRQMMWVLRLVVLDCMRMNKAIFYLLGSKRHYLFVKWQPSQESRRCLLGMLPIYSYAETFALPMDEPQATSPSRWVRCHSADRAYSEAGFRSHAGVVTGPSTRYDTQGWRTALWWILQIWKEFEEKGSRQKEKSPGATVC